jgi:hypothetical protein
MGQPMITGKQIRNELNSDFKLQFNYYLTEEQNQRETD